MDNNVSKYKQGQMILIKSKEWFLDNTDRLPDGNRAYNSNMFSLHHGHLDTITGKIAKITGIAQQMYGYVYAVVVYDASHKQITTARLVDWMISGEVDADNLPLDIF